MKKKRLFNMIEIALAIAILAVGATATIGLLPLIFDSNTSATGSYYAATSASNLISYIEYLANVSNKNWRKLFVDSDHIIPTTKTNISPSPDNTSGWEKIKTGNIDTLYYLPEYPEGNNKGVYGIKVESDSNVDFAGIAILWYNSISEDSGISNAEIPIDTDTAVQLYLEINWPVERPYSTREKLTFTKIIYNENS